MPDTIDTSTQEGTPIQAASAAAISEPVVSTQTTILPPAQADGEEFDKERAMATIKKLRDFEKTAKAQLKELEDLRAAKQVAEDAKLSESERLQKQLEETKAQAQTAETERQKALAELTAERRLNQVTRIAGTLGAIDPNDANIVAATATLDPTSATAEADTRAAIEALKTAKPYLFRQAPGARVEPFNPGTASGNAQTDQQIVNRLQSQAQTGKTPFG